MELVHGTMELGPITNAVFTLMRRFLAYMVTHGASPITNAVSTLMRRFLVYMVTHGASPRYHGARSECKCSVYIDASLSGLHG